MRTALEYIRSNYHQHVDLEDVAEAANSSATHLRRQFKDATGMTPIQYLMDIRMAAAKQLLLTDLKVFEVACLVGIEDHSYSGRLFRKITGVSPQKYREQTAKAARRGGTRRSPAKRRPSKKSNSPTI
ncbi:MAG: helix-turn-helix transcriptional regulator [Phycisphaerae bacterium]|nr:helix-turn-helix transcriptional regulator [Phycisphaerae bacterium]